MAASVAHDDARHLDSPAVDADPDDERAVNHKGGRTAFTTGRGSTGGGGEGTNQAAIDPAAGGNGGTGAAEHPTGFAGVIGVTALPNWGDCAPNWGDCERRKVG